MLYLLHLAKYKCNSPKPYSTRLVAVLYLLRFPIRICARTVCYVNHLQQYNIYISICLSKRKSCCILFSCLQHPQHTAYLNNFRYFSPGYIYGGVSKVLSLSDQYRLPNEIFMRGEINTKTPLGYFTSRAPKTRAYKAPPSSGIVRLKPLNKKESTYEKLH